MRGAMLYGPGDLRFEERAEPKFSRPASLTFSRSSR